MNITQTKSTRNQSELTISHGRKIAIFDNRFDYADITSTTAITVTAGNLVARGTDGKVVLATTANLAKVIGIAVETVDIPANGTLNLNYVVSGTVDQNALVLPATVTLLTPVVENGITLKDHLNGLGLHLEDVVSNSKS